MVLKNGFEMSKAFPISYDVTLLKSELHWLGGKKKVKWQFDFVWPP